ncbi:hypothetical protein DPEC_G00198550 [Dallia pectoralis]|uniref:Uncharacterized protein n=1 Tax=Dallia pectoralis TaxID=75939 RepID=A0ACC2G878_DALPE|nr:hypothetical protein DPEC_G00198550 [Dallia pectoralis]
MHSPKSGRRQSSFTGRNRDSTPRWSSDYSSRERSCSVISPRRRLARSNTMTRSWSGWRSNMCSRAGEMTRKTILLKAQPSEEQRFYQKQQQELNETLQKGVQEHKRKVASMEWDISVKMQQVKRARESVIWEMEQRHLQEKYHLFKQQVKEQYSLQRQQLTKRHSKDTDRATQFHRTLLDEQKAQQAQERNQLQRAQRTEAKAMLAHFKTELKKLGLSGPEHRQRLTVVSTGTVFISSSHSTIS